MQRSLSESIRKTIKNLLDMAPLLAGTLFLLGLVITIVPDSLYHSIFGKIFFLNAITGGILGSVLAGNPIESYIIGGELLKKGVGLAAATAFIISWVTVGVVQIPIEAKAIGKKFTLWRNFISFIFAVLIGIATTVILGRW
ncbi:MAG: hypothetical protein V1860_03370 [bacterium]